MNLFINKLLLTNKKTYAGSPNLMVVGFLVWLKSVIFTNHLKVRHPFHLLDPSPWPIFVSFFLALNLGYLVCLKHFQDYSSSWSVSVLGLVFLSLVLSWFMDVRLEELKGHHTKFVQAGFRLGILFFIASEIMLFVSFFWAFFQFSISPTVHVGLKWPMDGITYFSWTKIPLLNTALLLSSGISITLAHEISIQWDYYKVGYFWKKIVNRLPIIFNNKNYLKSFIYAQKVVFKSSFPLITSTFRLGQRPEWFFIDTLARGYIFLLCQYIEYFFSPFSISDGAYGSVFFMATGLHGLHVIVGLSALMYCLSLRIFQSNEGFLYWEHSVGTDGSIWYWHFVDVVWLFLFLVVYWWSAS